ncbi:carbon-nitrogen hydrolase [Teratosphaeria nubilosa]|uniref:Carbon-nitrogen hydrolase n=1 Tax=Teratosphaeria nubilosa TaxID=161662 RepID=A0A6G1LI33_9PEZI|nr:carbon-nitrogen hydrolase [Teratosphaeria nubilosa]
MASLTLRAAACHAAPVFLSAKQTTDKCINLIHRAAKNKAHLVVFPETFLPAFPLWSSLRAPSENHKLFKRMVQESVHADGAEIGEIRSAAKAANVMVSVGISEKARYSSGTLWNANLFIGADGSVLNHHRKLVATFFEKLTWAPGDGYGLKVLETPFGRIGNLICGENTNPLAKYALMAQGEQVHISSWPAVWPTRSLSQAPAAGGGGGGGGARNYDNVAANRTRAAAHCFEAKCFGILNSAFLDQGAIEIASDGVADVRETLKASQRGATMYLDPTGAALPGYTIDASTGQRKRVEFLQDREDILYADLDLADCVEGKQYHDVVGGYQRLDVFDLRVNRVRREPATFADRPSSAGEADVSRE